MSIKADAPSNIALIKYMGKTCADKNKPTNASISFTLEKLRTFVTAQESTQDDWQPLVSDLLLPVLLSVKGKTRFLDHWSFLKQELKISGNYLIKSANNFPSDCGLASSASSFAALTKLAVKVAQKESSQTNDLSLKDIAALSRQGSGSSCRSFISPWCEWDEQGIRSFKSSQFNNLHHMVVIVEDQVKEVSSSEAHSRVLTSCNFKGRAQRAQERLEQLKRNLTQGDWAELYQVCWAEFWDMHCLFETSKPHFGYIKAGSLEIIKYVESIWQQREDGPVVTMDAGANVHLLYREDQSELCVQMKKELLESFSVELYGGVDA